LIFDLEKMVPARQESKGPVTNLSGPGVPRPLSSIRAFFGGGSGGIRGTVR